MRANPVLVIGAAHLDIVGDYGSYVRAVLDKPGEITYSVGGTAYNVAANLAQSGVPVSFVSSLRQGSLITPIILSRLTSYNIDTNKIGISPLIDESGFLAHREDGRLVSAVTASTMEKFNFVPADYSDELSKCRFIIADCNVASTALNKIQLAASEHGKKLIVAGVSEPKIKRILEIDRKDSVPFPFFIVSGNCVEGRSIGIDVDHKMERGDIMDDCQRIGSEMIIITNSDKGYSIFSLSGTRIDMPAPDVTRIISQTGAGDALLAAVCQYYYDQRDFNWDKCHLTVGRFVSQVLGRKGATVGARTAPDELRVIPQADHEAYKLKQSERIIQVVGSDLVNLFGAKIPKNELFGLIGLVVAIVASILALLTGG